MTLRRRDFAGCGHPQLSSGDHLRKCVCWISNQGQVPSLLQSPGAEQAGARPGAGLTHAVKITRCRKALSHLDVHDHRHRLLQPHTREHNKRRPLPPNAAVREEDIERCTKTKSMRAGFVVLHPLLTVGASFQPASALLAVAGSRRLVLLFLLLLLRAGRCCAVRLGAR